jgi:hypothetical protein
MTRPKRGIELCDTTLIDYDVRIKTGGEEEDDLQLIDGVSLVHPPFPCHEFDSIYKKNTGNICITK